MPQPKKPQDHKQAAAEEEKPDGWDLLKSPDHVPVWDQADLVARIAPLTGKIKGDSDTIEIEDTPEMVRFIGEIARALLPYAVDQDAYVRFVSGRGALQRSAELSIWYVGLLGE